MNRLATASLAALLVAVPHGDSRALDAQEPPIPIVEAKADRDDDWYADRSGQIVTVEGVVTYKGYPAREGEETRAYIEDATGGLRLVSISGESLGEIERGDRVRVTGVLGHDRGLERLDVLSLTVLGTGAAVVPLGLTVDDLMGRAEELTGLLVRVRGPLRKRADTLMIAGVGRAVRLYLRPSVFDDPSGALLLANGGTVEVVGVLEQADSRSLPNGRYRITPRDPDDLSQAATALVLGAPVPSAQAPGAPAPSSQVPTALVPGTPVPSPQVPGAPAPSSQVPGAPAPSSQVPTALVPGAQVPQGPIPLEQVFVDADRDWFPDRLGDLVTVEGVVTYEAYAARGGDEARAYLQDLTGGVRLRAFDPRILTELDRGERVRVQGVVDQDNGMSVLFPASVTVLGPGEVLEPTDLSIATLVDSAESWVGRLVRVRGRARFLDDDIHLVDEEAAIRLYLRDSAFPDEFDQQLLDSGVEVEAIGLVEQNDGDVPLTSGYRLTPRDQADVTQLGGDPVPRILGWLLVAVVAISGAFALYILVSRRRAHAWAALVQELRASQASVQAREAELRAEIEQKELAEMGRKHAEVQLIQAQKMESLGTLAGGIAHDFNNLLSVMLGHVELLLAGSELPEGLTTEVREIQQAGERARDLVSQILAFSRQQILKMERLSLDEFVEAERSLLRRLLPEDVHLHMELGSEAHASADVTQLTQVLVNLTTNACDAMPDGGALTLRTRVENVAETIEHALGILEPGRYAVLEVADTGTGMDEAVLARAFDPFFTTKDVGQGTGLGLATVHGIVKQSDGQLRVESEPGHGTVFRIYLPLAESPVRRDEARAPSSVVHLGTVLLVEDDAMVRRVTARMLQSFCDEVLEAADGEEALLLFAEHRARIELVVTDVVMPGMSGADLAARIAAEAPELPILLLSGYPDGRTELSEIPDHHFDVMAKPISLSGLTARVAALVGAR